MSGEINCEEIVIIFLFTKLSYPRDSKETSWSLSQSAICQHVSTTRGECFAFFFLLLNIKQGSREIDQMVS